MRYEGKNYKLVRDIKRNINDLDEKIENLSTASISNNVAESLESDIKTIEGNIEQVKRNNVKNAIIRKVKISLRFIQLILPFVIILGGTTVASYFAGDIPFIPEQEFFYKHHETTFDSLGAENDEESFISTNITSVNHTAYFSTKWEQKADGKYYRTTRKYDFTDYDLAKLKEMIKDPNLNFEEAFGKANSNTYEAKAELSEEDSMDSPYIKIIFRYNDDEDIILKAQNMGSNIIYGVIWLVITLFLEFGAYVFRSETSNFNFSDCLEEYAEKYRKEDVEELKKLLEEKKITIEKVMRVKEKDIDVSNNGQHTKAK